MRIYLDTCNLFYYKTFCNCSQGLSPQFVFSTWVNMTLGMGGLCVCPVFFSFYVLRLFVSQVFLPTYLNCYWLRHKLRARTFKPNYTEGNKSLSVPLFTICAQLQLSYYCGGFYDVTPWILHAFHHYHILFMVTWPAAALPGLSW